MKDNLTHIHLIGDSQENFYILGRRDKNSYHEIYNQISTLCSRNKNITKVLKLLNDISYNIIYKKTESTLLKDLKSYAEGLEISYKELMYAFLLPEVVSSFNKWFPNLMSLVPGCSSLFLPNPNGGTIHARILDYALSGAFEIYERSILYDFKGRYKTFSYNSTGLPFASLSSMNEKGLTMALHYKHSDFFDLEGESIFFITAEIMYSCANIREALRLLRKKRSIAHWGIYLSDKNGEVAAINIKGQELYQEKFNIKDHTYLYFNNIPILKNENLSQLQPFGHTQFCNLRKFYINKAIKSNYNRLIEDPLKESIKLLGKLPSNNAKQWSPTTINSSSIQLLSFDNQNFQSYYQPGLSPKIFDKSLIKYESIFDKNLKILKNQGSNASKSQILKQKAFTHLSKFQVSIDSGDMTGAYHHIQMGKELLSSSGEKAIAEFYYLILQYINENDKKDLLYIHKNLCQLIEKLPIYLKDHAYLFKLRLSILCGIKIPDDVALIQNKNLKRYFHHEKKLNIVTLNALKHLIFPRIDNYDILYAY